MKDRVVDYDAVVLAIGAVVGEVVVDESLFGFEEVGFKVVVASQFYRNQKA